MTNRKTVFVLEDLADYLTMIAIELRMQGYDVVALYHGFQDTFDRSKAFTKQEPWGRCNAAAIDAMDSDTGLKIISPDFETPNVEGILAKSADAAHEYIMERFRETVAEYGAENIIVLSDNMLQANYLGIRFGAHLRTEFPQIPVIIHTSLMPSLIPKQACDHMFEKLNLASGLFGEDLVEELNTGIAKAATRNPSISNEPNTTAFVEGTNLKRQLD